MQIELDKMFDLLYELTHECDRHDSHIAVSRGEGIFPVELNYIEEIQQFFITTK